MQIPVLIGKGCILPKLELQATLIGLRPVTSTKQFLLLKIKATLFWSDTSTVFQWIDSSHKRLHVSGDNCVADFLDHSRVDEWIFVPGIQNAADIVTCGMK